MPFAEPAAPDADVLELEDVDLQEALALSSQLIVYNDDVNTFDWVIQCLVEVCEHSPEQAEQNAMIIHYKGKSTVKEGGFDELRPMKDALCERGLSAVIESEYA